MPLKGKKPDQIEKRLKMFIYGGAGVGKTTSAIQFPKPYFIDTEKGGENKLYADLLNKSGGVIFQSVDYDEIIQEIKALLTEKHDFLTLVIDPLTTIYNDLLDKSALKHGTEFGRHYNEANKKMKNLINLLLRLDMNIIITSHAKNEYGQNLAVLGQTYDCYKKIDYLFDLVLEIKKSGSDRIAVVRKSRITTFEDGANFSFNYQEISNRYGKDIMEKEVSSQELASEEQISEINKLIDLLNVPSEVVDKWMRKAQSDSFDQMKSDDIQNCIGYLKDKIK